jgi:hypothetical protein
VPNAQIINAAFTHAHPLGSRFNGPERGAWYARFALETQAEITFHKTVQFSEIGCFDDEASYADCLADFSGDFHDLREDRSLLTAWPRILRKIPGARSRFIGGRFPWRRLSERPARGRNMRCVFQAGGGLERPFWAQLPLRLVRKINPNYNQGEPMTDRHRLKDS